MLRCIELEPLATAAYSLEDLIHGFEAGASILVIHLNLVALGFFHHGLHIALFVNGNIPAGDEARQPGHRVVGLLILLLQLLDRLLHLGEAGQLLLHLLLVDFLKPALLLDLKLAASSL